MKHLALVCLLSLLAACVATDEVSLAGRTLPYACDDYVVVGRVHNESLSTIPNENDILGHSNYFGTIRVRRTVRGHRLPSTIRVRYGSHGEIRDDSDFMFVLKKEDDGAFSIKTAQLMSVNPLLAAVCN